MGASERDKKPPDNSDHFFHAGHPLPCFKAADANMCTAQPNGRLPPRLCGSGARAQDRVDTRGWGSYTDTPSIPQEAKMKLFYRSGACSLSPHIVLREAGLPFELDLIATKTGKTQSGGDFASINPKGYVPTLQLDDGQFL